MDIQHMKYAVEVERSKSISKAAEKLYVSQPFLSKAIRELELDIGIEIFNRTSRGVVPTKRGELFLARAKEILADVDELESSYKTKPVETCHFEITVPIACYISEAFVEFTKELDSKDEIKINYRETNTMSSIKHVAEHDCDLGIIRYKSLYEDYFLRYIESKDLEARPIWEFKYHLVMSRNNPLAGKEHIDEKDLTELIEISHGDPDVPSLSSSAMLELKRQYDGKRNIVVYERQSQFALLCEMPRTYMWASPTPEGVFRAYPLVERDCDMQDNSYKDVLIWRKGYRFTGEDRLFVGKLSRTVEELSKR